MSTYLEIVIQERSTDGRSILTHRHLHIPTNQAGTLTHYLTRLLAEKLTNLNESFTASDPLRPCHLCWQFRPEAPHDPR